MVLRPKHNEMNLSWKYSKYKRHEKIIVKDVIALTEFKGPESEKSQTKKLRIKIKPLGIKQSWIMAEKLESCR